LKAQILSFNVDRRFSNVIDSLILIDLKKTDFKLLRRFMGSDGLRSFTNHHGVVLENIPFVSPQEPK
jgi:hypothetical protein